MNLSSERFVRLLASLRPEDGVTSDQRRAPRAEVRASVLLAPCETKGLGSACVVRLLNISGTDCPRLQSVIAIAPGKQFVVDLPDFHENEGTPDDSQRLRILCKVVHCRPNGTQFMIGAQFLRLWTAPAPTLDTALAAA